MPSSSSSALSFMFISSVPAVTLKAEVTVTNLERIEEAFMAGAVAGKMVVQQLRFLH